MAISGALASTVGILVLISLTNGQIVERPIPACNPAETQAGIYMMAHPNFAQMFIQCFGNLQYIMMCPEGTIWDQTSISCNHIPLSNSSAAPCNPNLVGRRYPTPCCEKFFQCNGGLLELTNCSNGQVFNAQSGQCGPVGGCTDHAKCSRNMPPSGIPRPCPLRADPSNPCNFRMEDNGTLSAIQSCAEGSALDLTSCTCVSNSRCMRSANSSGGKTPDSQCRASLKVDFTAFQPGTNVPQVFSDKTQRNVNEHVEAVGVQYGTAQATLSSNPVTNSPAYFYMPVFSNNRVAKAFITEITFRATQQGSFEIIANNYNGVCAATFSFNATYNGAGGYQVIGFITGATDVGTGTPVTNVLQVSSLNIQVGQTDFVLLRFIFSDRFLIQLINKGQSGTFTQGQPVSADYPSIGDYLHYNKCGYQICRGLTGVVKSYLFREACLNTELARN